LRRVDNVEAKLSTWNYFACSWRISSKNDFAAKPASLPHWQVDLCNSPSVAQSGGELVDVLVLGQVVCIVTWDEQVVDFLPRLTVCGNTVYVETIVAPNFNKGSPVWIGKNLNISCNWVSFPVVVLMFLYTLISDLLDLQLIREIDLNKLPVGILPIILDQYICHPGSEEVLEQQSSQSRR
jgi:hypothetical protein